MNKCKDMSKSEEYLADYEIDETSKAHDRKFDLIPCNTKQYIIALGILSIILAGLILMGIFSDFELWVGIYATGMSLLQIFIIPLLWHNVFKRFIKNDIAPALDAYKNKKIPETKNFGQKIKRKVNNIFGITFNPDFHYYIEAEPLDCDLRDTQSLLTDYVFKVTSTALGFSFLITTIVSMFLEVTPDNWYIILYVSLGLAFASPIIVAPLIPIWWTIKDASVKFITEQHVIHTFGYQITKRVLDRFVGKGGVLMGITTIFRFVSNTEFPEIELGTFGQLVAFILVFLAMVIMMGVPCLLCTMRYLRHYHQENVNLTRNILKTVLPVGYTVVRAETRNKY